MKNNQKSHRVHLILTLLFCGLWFSCYQEAKFVPLSAKIDIAEHFQGAEATIIQLTDHYFPNSYSEFESNRIKNSAAYAEFLGFKYNIPLHVFEEYKSWDEFDDFLKIGRGGASVYYPSCDKEYNKSKLNSLIKNIKKKYDRSPTTISYGCGVTDYVHLLPEYILGGRNSSAAFQNQNQAANTWYGKNCGNGQGVDYSKIENILNRPAGGRFYAEIQRYGTTLVEATRYTQEQVQETIKSHGFYTNFMHWHDYYANKKGDTIEGVKVMPFLFEALNEGIGNANTSKIDYNEAIEYLYAKEAIDSVYLSKNAASQFQINFIFNKKRPVDYSVIKTPITVIISKEALKNIQLKSLFFESDYGPGTTQDQKNIYLNIPLDFSKERNSIDLRIGNSEETILFAFEKPQLSMKDDRTIQTSTPAKFVLFRRKKTGPQYEIEIVDRKFDYVKEYRLKDLDKGYHYFCGAINKQRESTLMELSL